MVIKLSFADRIDDLISEKKKEGMTEGGIAKALGIQPPTLTAYKNGDRRPNFDILLRIAEYFDVSLDWLAGRSEYRNDKNKHIDAVNLGLSDRAVIAMLSFSFLSAGINLLVEHDVFSYLLQAFSKFYFACEADCVLDEARLYYARLNGGKIPTYKQLSEMLGKAAINNKLEPETQSKLFTLCERLERAQEVSLFTDDAEDRAFLNRLQMRDIYELQTTKHLIQLTEELRAKAENRISHLSLFNDPLAMD